MERSRRDLCRGKHDPEVVSLTRGTVREIAGNVREEPCLRHRVVQCKRRLWLSPGTQDLAGTRIPHTWEAPGDDPSGMWWRRGESWFPGLLCGLAGSSVLNSLRYCVHSVVTSHTTPSPFTSLPKPHGHSAACTAGFAEGSGETEPFLPPVPSLPPSFPPSFLVFIFERGTQDPKRVLH